MPPASPDPRTLEDEFLAGLERDPPNPGYLPDEGYYAERARAELAGRLAD